MKSTCESASWKSPCPSCLCLTKAVERGLSLRLCRAAAPPSRPRRAMAASPAGSLGPRALSDGQANLARDAGLLRASARIRGAARESVSVPCVGRTLGAQAASHALETNCTHAGKPVQFEASG
jgi:hypothetical protein